MSSAMKDGRKVQCYLGGTHSIPQLVLFIENEITPTSKNVPITIVSALSGPPVARPYFVLAVSISP